MVVQNRWGDKRLVVTIYDAEYNKLRIKSRKIQVIDFDKECAVVADYLGKF